MQMKYALCFLLFCACSQLKTGSQTTETSREVPEWVYSPYNSCLEAEELCATGEGKTFHKADTQARNNLASIFEIKVKSELKVQTSSSQAYPWQANVRQDVQQSLQESVEQVLETVQIKKHFSKDGLTYALASLDRIKGSELIGNRLYLLDKEISQLWKTRQRTSMRKIVRLTLEREKLNEKYSIISGNPRPAHVDYEEVLSWRDTKPSPVALNLKIGQAPDWMSEKIEELLTEAGFKLVKGNAAKALSMNVTSIREHLNVKGFEKYTFTLSLTSIEEGKMNKTISTSETVTGRSQADALLKVKKYFNNYLEQNLSALHLD